MYTVALAGLGHRGKIHTKGFLENQSRFRLAALCDIDETKLRNASEQYGIDNVFQSTEQMLDQVRPDVFCFATLPDVRLSMVKLAVKYGVKALAFEKPMATSLREAQEIVSLCQAAGIKAVVSHQQKYLPSLQKLKCIVDSGDIGETIKIHATTQAWLSQLGTHYMDYVLWISGGAKAQWVAGHVHGKEKLADHHPSPDFILGEVLLNNGVRAYIECGYLGPSHLGKENFWLDNRITVYGTHGYAWAQTDGSWGAFTQHSQGQTIGGTYEGWLVQEKKIQTPYLKELADWLDDSRLVHSCNVETAYHGYEILEGLCISALEHTVVHLPLEVADTSDINERLRAELPNGRN